MTGEETIIALKIKLDKLDTQSLPEITTEVAVFWINDTIGRIIKQRYGGNNPQGSGFEETQKRTDDLREVIKYLAIDTPASGFFDNSKEFDLPPDYWFAIVEQADVIYIDCFGDQAEDRVGITAIQHNNINTAVEKDPFWKPEEKELLRTMHGSKVTLFHSPGATVPKYYLGYVNNDFKVDLSDLTPELKISNHLHSEVVDQAYNQILNAVESGRYQQDLNELVKTE